MATDFTKLITDTQPQTQEAQRTTGSINTKEFRQITLKLQ